MGQTNEGLSKSSQAVVVPKPPQTASVSWDEAHVGKCLGARTVHVAGLSTCRTGEAAAPGGWIYTGVGWKRFMRDAEGRDTKLELTLDIRDESVLSGCTGVAALLDALSPVWDAGGRVSWVDDVTLVACRTVERLVSILSRAAGLGWGTKPNMKGHRNMTFFFLLHVSTDSRLWRTQNQNVLNETCAKISVRWKSCKLSGCSYKSFLRPGLRRVHSPCSTSSGPSNSQPLPPSHRGFGCTSQSSTAQNTHTHTYTFITFMWSFLVE